LKDFEELIQKNNIALPEEYVGDLRIY